MWNIYFGPIEQTVCPKYNWRRPTKIGVKRRYYFFSLILFRDKVLSFLIQKLSLSCLLLSSHLGLWSIMVTFSLTKNIMVARRSEMSVEWKVRFAICIASVAIQAFTKLLFSFSDVLKAANCTFQEVDTIFCLAVGIAVYYELFFCMCAAEFLCPLDVFSRHTSSQITFLTLTIVGRSREMSALTKTSFKLLGFQDFAQFWVFLYCCPVLTNDVG